MKRRLARELALQSLYQMQMNEVSPQEAIQMVIDEAQHENEGKLDVKNEVIHPGYVEELVAGTIQHRAEIDRLLEQYIKGYTMERLSRVDREVLRLATYEMIYRDDVPPKVVVNEAIELAKHFGTEESGKFVNGVLGKMILELAKLKSQV
ncbi:transcription antitermination factor NusB [Paenibacillus senegalensis]|uniref:transcription antitermination factor NusB n=1 Tax=Paenibacillus senegalensis TaxID=1465766 RepID=UPI000287F641|nr:transcription antitermination factor NusB [Paenibacillus senegalensis]